MNWQLRLSRCFLQQPLDLMVWPPIFFQKFWSTVGNDVTNVALMALNTGMFPFSLNHTFITLIPKKKNLEELLDYRLISLFNVLYKIVAKKLTNPLKVILSKGISNTHSNFILGRLIFDNVLIAYEVMHYMSMKKKGK